MKRSHTLAALVVVLLVHGALGWLYWMPAPKVLWGDEEMYQAVAADWSTGGDARLEPLWPPLYPRFVALVLSVSGGGIAAVQMIQLGLLAGCALLLRDLWRRLVAPDRVGDMLAIGLLAYPPIAAYSRYLWPEVLHLFLLLLAAWILVARSQRRGWCLALGLVLGAALSTKSLLGPFIPVLLVPLAVRGPWPERGRRVGLALAGLLLVMVPQIVSELRTEGVTTASASARFNLWVGLNDTSRRAFVDEVVGREYQAWLASAATVEERHRILGDKIEARIAGENALALLADQAGRQYFRLLDRDSFLTAQLPGGTIYARGAGYRDAPAALAVAIRFASYAAWGVLLVAAALGVAVCPMRGRGWIAMMLAFLAYNGLLFLCVHVKSRYRVQFEPVLLVFAALFVAGWLERRRGATGPIAPRFTLLRVAAGIAAALVLLFLAFGAGLLDG